MAKKLRGEPKWLDRCVIAHPCLKLCLSEAEFLSTIAPAKLKNPPAWLDPGSDAECHSVTAENVAITCVVCLDGSKPRDAIDVIGLLAHEAVHVMSRVKDMYPGSVLDEEATSVGVQMVTQRLVEEWTRRTGGARLSVSKAPATRGRRSK